MYLRVVLCNKLAGKVISLLVMISAYKSSTAKLLSVGKTFYGAEDEIPGDDGVIIPDIAVTAELVLFIGREDPRQGGQHLNLEHPRVSKKQCMIHKEKSHFVVLDYELEFGTFVNLRFVTAPLKLFDHDLLGFAAFDIQSFSDLHRNFLTQRVDPIMEYANALLALQFEVRVTEEGILLKHLRGRRYTLQ